MPARLRPPLPAPRRQRGGVLGEALVVIVLGVAVGLAANALRDDGLELGRDYFFATTPAGSGAPNDTDAAGTPAAGTGTDDTGTPDGTPPAPAAEPYVEVLDPAVLERLTAKGLQFLTHDETVAAWKDPAREMGMFVFIDARSDSFYAEGHIPGAYQFDHYHQDRFLPTVLPVVTDPLVARVIVYCRGGECEDSELAAMNLMVRGVPREKLFVYVGGYEAWKAAGLPLEKGERQPPEPPGR